MARQVINIGTSPNDGTGDPLRTAFDKINQNFTDLYVNFGSSEIQLVGNSIVSSSTNYDININPNGSGRVVTGVNNPVIIKNTIDSSSGTTGALTVAGGIGAALSIHSDSLVSAPVAAFGQIATTGVIEAGDDITTNGQMWLNWVDQYGVPKTGSGAIMPGNSNAMYDSVFDKVFDIGSSTRRFSNIYVDVVHANTVTTLSTGFTSIDATPIGLITPDNAAFVNMAAVTGTFTDLSVGNPFEVSAGNLVVSYDSVMLGNTNIFAPINVGPHDISNNPVAGPAILPLYNAFYDIGNSSNAFRNLYLTGGATLGSNLLTNSNVTVTGTSSYFVGNLLGRASTATSAGTATYATNSGTSNYSTYILGSNQPNITSLGTLQTLTVSDYSFFGNVAFANGNLNVLGSTQAMGGFQTFTEDLGVTTGTYTLNLGYDATNFVKMEFNTNLTFAYYSNVMPGNMVTVIAHNADSANHTITLPNNKNNKNSTTITVNAGVYATLTFNTINNTTSDVYVAIVNN